VSQQLCRSMGGPPGPLPIIHAASCYSGKAFTATSMSCPFSAPPRPHQPPRHTWATPRPHWASMLRTRDSS